MVRCDHCEDEVDYLPFICRYCGKSYCKKHRIPENHECSFEFKNDPFKVKSMNKAKSSKVYADYPAESYPKPSSSKRVRIREPRIRRNRTRPQVTTLLGMQAKPYGTYGLMIANVFFFAISVILSFINENLQSYLYLSISDYTDGFSYWTFLTSMFLSISPLASGAFSIFIGFLYMFIKIFMLFFIGRMIETRWGWKTLIKIYLLSGLLSSAGILIVQLVSSFFISSIAGVQYFSSWGATMGLIAFISFLFPQQQITMFLYFIPIRVKMKNLLLILIGIAVFYGVFNILAQLINPSPTRILSFPQNFGGIAGILGGLIIFRSIRRNA